MPGLFPKQTLPTIGLLINQVGERARRAQAHHEWQTERQFDQVREIGQAMATALTLPELIHVLSQELPQLDIPRCYLALYKDSHKPTEWSRLVLAFDESGNIPLEPGERRFASRQLLPAGILAPERASFLLRSVKYDDFLTALRQAGAQF